MLKINASNARKGDLIKLEDKYVEIKKISRGFDGGIFAFTEDNDSGYLIKEGTIEMYDIFRKEE